MAGTVSARRTIPRCRRVAAHSAGASPSAAATPIAFQYPNGAVRRPNVLSGTRVEGNTLASNAYALSAAIAVAMPPTTPGQRAGNRRASAIAPANALT